MTEPQATIITAAELWHELQSLDAQHLRLVMPVGALIRSVPIVTVQGHDRVVELNTAYGEVITFTASDTAEIRRVREVKDERTVTRYEVRSDFSSRRLLRSRQAEMWEWAKLDSTPYLK